MLALHIGSSAPSKYTLYLNNNTVLQVTNSQTKRCNFKVALFKTRHL